MKPSHHPSSLTDNWKLQGIEEEKTQKKAANKR